MFSLSSPAFHSNDTIPRKYTGEGDDLSPPLKWIDVPESAQELAILCEDPDSGPEPWVHWLIYGISPTRTNGLPEGIPTDKQIERPIEATQGRNSFGRIGYGGPLPPPGRGEHRYFFKLFALDQKLNLRPGMTKDDFFKAINRHVLSEATFMGCYERAVKRKAA